MLPIPIAMVDPTGAWQHAISGKITRQKTMLIPPGNSGHGMKWQLWISLKDAQVEGVAVDFSHPQLVSVWDCCCFFPCFLTQKSGFGIAGFCYYKIQDALQRATFDSNSQVGAIFQILHTKESPPTYFRTNKFTSSFQEIVDAYGCCKMHNPLFFVD